MKMYNWDKVSPEFYVESGKNIEEERIIRFGREYLLLQGIEEKELKHYIIEFRQNRSYERMNTLEIRYRFYDKRTLIK